MTILEKSIKHFEGLQKRYMTQHNGEMCQMVDCALKAMNEIRWIPVGETMPNEREKQDYVFDPNTYAIIDIKKYMGSHLVLVTVRDYELDIDFTMTDRTIDKNWVNFEADGRYEIITWRPMPEPQEEPDLNDKVCNELSKWPQWKKEAYNECFKSKHSTELK